MKIARLVSFAVLFIASITLGRAADLAGKWTSEFDSQIGVQKYSFEFKQDAGSFTGKASYEHSMGKGDSALKNIKQSGDDVSFTESLRINDVDLVVTYSGKISGDEIKLTRVVGDIATEQIVAKRVKAAEAKPAPTK